MLKRTALFEEHQRLQGRMVDFGGWELPVQYSGVMDEHLACRRVAGLFDVSHMGEFHVEGPGAEAFLNELVTNDVSRLVPGQALYTAMCLEHGGIVDDLVIYRRDAGKFLVVVNASNTDKDFEHAQKVLKSWRESQAPGAGAVELANKSSQYTQIAIQGRRAEAILQKLTATPLSHIKTYCFAEGKVLSEVPAVLARTGYTGEDGFEVYVPWSDGPAVWNALLEAGEEYGIVPCGLGARDTLRLEMKYPLYGNELTETTHPLEAGLGWVVKLGKPSFVGKRALEKFKSEGLSRKLVGLELKERGIPRQGYVVFSADGSKEIGVVTSGTQSPSLGRAIGIAYVGVDHAEVGNAVSVEIRGRKIRAEIVPTPFYKRDY